MAKQKNILYRPNIDYEREYDTVGAFKDESIDNSVESSNSKLEDLKESIDNINNMAQLLPDDLKDILSKPLGGIEHIIGDVEDPNKIPEIDEVITILPKDEIIPENEDIYPDTPFSDYVDDLIIEVTKNDVAEVIKREYEYDLISIIDDYINNLNKTMDKYVKNILLLLKDFDVKLYPKILSTYNNNTGTVSTDYKHISDLIIRSQISRNMKVRLYNKLFNTDKTITHIRMCKVGVQQRIRYYQSQYTNQNDYENVISNRLLENSRLLYDKKYEQNFVNLYKYLNSSVMVLDECFNMCINEAQAKIILMKKEGNDLW